MFRSLTAALFAPISQLASSISAFGNQDIGHANSQVPVRIQQIVSDESSSGIKADTEIADSTSTASSLRSDTRSSISSSLVLLQEYGFSVPEHFEDSDDDDDDDDAQDQIQVADIGSNLPPLPDMGHSSDQQLSAQASHISDKNATSPRQALLSPSPSPCSADSADLPSSPHLETTMPQLATPSQPDHPTSFAPAQTPARASPESAGIRSRSFHVTLRTRRRMKRLDLGLSLEDRSSSSDELAGAQTENNETSDPFPLSFSSSSPLRLSVDSDQLGPTRASDSISVAPSISIASSYEETDLSETLKRLSGDEAGDNSNRYSTPSYLLSPGTVTVLTYSSAIDQDKKVQRSSDSNRAEPQADTSYWSSGSYPIKQEQEPLASATETSEIPDQRLPVTVKHEVDVITAGDQQEMKETIEFGSCSSSSYYVPQSALPLISTPAEETAASSFSIAELNQENRMSVHSRGHAVSDLSESWTEEEPGLKLEPGEVRLSITQLNQQQILSTQIKLETSDPAVKLEAINEVDAKPDSFKQDSPCRTELQSRAEPAEMRNVELSHTQISVKLEEEEERKLTRPTVSPEFPSATPKLEEIFIPQGIEAAASEQSDSGKNPTSLNSASQAQTETLDLIFSSLPPLERVEDSLPCDLPSSSEPGFPTNSMEIPSIPIEESEDIGFGPSEQDMAEPEDSLSDCTNTQVERVSQPGAALTATSALIPVLPHSCEDEEPNSSRPSLHLRSSSPEHAGVVDEEEEEADLSPEPPKSRGRCRRRVLASDDDEEQPAEVDGPQKVIGEQTSESEGLSSTVQAKPVDPYRFSVTMTVSPLADRTNRSANPISSPSHGTRTLISFFTPRHLSRPALVSSAAIPTLPSIAATAPIHRTISKLSEEQKKSALAFSLDDAPQQEAEEDEEEDGEDGIDLAAPTPARKRPVSRQVIKGTRLDAQRFKSECESESDCEDDQEVVYPVKTPSKQDRQEETGRAKRKARNPNPIYIDNGSWIDESDEERGEDTDAQEDGEEEEEEEEKASESQNGDDSSDEEWRGSDDSDESDASQAEEEEEEGEDEEDYNPPTSKRKGGQGGKPGSSSSILPISSPSQSQRSIDQPGKTKGKKGERGRSVQMPKLSKKNRVELSRQLYDSINKRVFDNRLPVDFELIWSAQLKTTAGRCHMARSSSSVSASSTSSSTSLSRFEGRTARIELASKVLDSYAKLESTLCHEMCHAASWLLDGINKPPHGRGFRIWGKRVEQQFPHIQVKSCHNYIIYYKWRYQCQQCQSQVGRHTNSLDLNRWRCKCGGKFQSLGAFKPDNTPIRSRKINSLESSSGTTPISANSGKLNNFALFVKENYNQIKKEMGKGDHKGVMKILAEKWKEEKMKRAEKGKGNESGIRLAERMPEGIEEEEGEEKENDENQVERDLISRTLRLSFDD